MLDDRGVTRFEKSLAANPEKFLDAMAPFRDGLVVGVECMFAWYWLSDLCEDQGIPFVLGHALYMKAIHGGKTKNDKIDWGSSPQSWAGRFTTCGTSGRRSTPRSS